MSKRFYILMMLLMAELPLSTLWAQEESGSTRWENVMTVDFGGGNETDDVFGESIPELDALGFDFTGDMTYAGGYTITKHYDTNSDWHSGGDHTYQDIRDKGYFLLINAPHSQFSKVPAYVLHLKNLCPGVNFNFSAYVANLSTTRAGAQEPNLGLGVYETAEPVDQVSVDAYKSMKISPTDRLTGDALDWKRLDLRFTLEREDLNEAFFIIVMDCPESGGWDFAIDDISIDVEQPIVSIENTDYIFQSPVTLTASFENNGFFRDLSTVKYVWEYSADGVNYTALSNGSGMYTDGPISYTIPSFVKEQNNGFYRVSIGYKDKMDSKVCTLRKVFPVKETKDRKLVTLCEGTSTTVDGFTISANSCTQDDDDQGCQIKHPTQEIYYTVKVVRPFSKTLDDESLCPDKVYAGLADDYQGMSWSLADIQNESAGNQQIHRAATHIHRNDAGCVDTSLSWTLHIGPSERSRLADPICTGQEFNHEVFNTKGVFTRDVSPEGQDCVVEHYSITVNQTYTQADTQYKCPGQTYRDALNNLHTFDGKVGQNDTIRVLRELKSSCGCDSSIGIVYIVRPAKRSVIDTVICANSGGYDFNGQHYEKPDYYPGLKMVIPSTNDDCDSTVICNLRILDSISNYHNPVDTTICYDSKFLGVRYTEPTEKGKPLMIRDTATYVSSTGCDSTNWYRLTVLKIQLKLEIKSDRETVCKGEEVEIYIKELEPKDVPYEWIPSYAGSATKKNFPATEDVDVKVIATRLIDTVRCQTEDIIHVKVKDSPTLEIESVDQKENLVTYSVTGGTEPYKMYLDKKLVEPAVFGEIRESSIGTHKLVVSDDNECTDEGSYDISPIPVIPMEFFSPNDDGSYDTWYIENSDVYPNCTVTVYDRFGTVVYKSRGYDNNDGWDGTYNGKPLPSTDYWYVINLPESDTQLMGHFTLIR